MLIQVADFWQLGLDPIAVSAISGTGTGDLMEQLVDLLPPPKLAEAVDESDKALAVAIVGRPNVGKSSILNSLVSKMVGLDALAPCCLSSGTFCQCIQHSANV